MNVRKLALLGLFMVTAGCYQTTVNTGLTPGSTMIEKPWAHSFVAGLVPIETIDAASECANGVARVETQHTFLNMVATVVTGYIYSPMSITVTCAAGSEQESAAAEDAIVVDVVGSSDEALEAGLREATLRSLESPVTAVYVRRVGD